MDQDPYETCDGYDKQHGVDNSNLEYFSVRAMAMRL